MVIPGSTEVPVIYTAHHASHSFEPFRGRVALTEEQMVRFSDYGTDLTLPTNGIASIIAERSRALGDLNRAPDDPNRFRTQDYGQPEKHNIWIPGHELTDQEKSYCQRMFYQPFHDEIIGQLRNSNRPALVIAWDNTAHYYIGSNEAGKPQTMRPFILSNRGQENSGLALPGEESSCEPEFLEHLAENFRSTLDQYSLPNEVLLNFVLKGGYICRQYSTRRNEAALRQQGILRDVQSLQLEYDMAITHDHLTLKPNTDKIGALRDAFSLAIQQTLDSYGLNG